MTTGRQVRLVFPAVLLIMIANAALWSQPAPQQRAAASIDGSTVRKSNFPASRARALEAQVQRIAPSQTMVAPPAAAAGEPRDTNEAGANRDAGAAAVPQAAGPVTTPRVPLHNSLQYVRTDNARLERELSTAIISQPQLQSRVEDSGAIAPLPGILRYTDSAGEAAQLKGFALISRRLAYDSAQRRYRGSIMLGLTDIVPGRPARTLSTPVVFQVVGADSATPAYVQVTRTNPPYPEVELELAAARPVRVLSDAIQDSIEIDLPLASSLTVEAGSTTIDGLGLGSTQLNISLAGVERPEGRAVTLQTDSGYLDSTLVRLDATGSASATLRSDGVRGARIVARTQGIAPAEASVDFRIPWLTFFASLIGGLAGGLIRARGRFRPLPLLVAALCGIVVFALYTGGINVLPFTLSVTVGATVVFAISALGGYGGPSLLPVGKRPAAPPPAPAAAPSISGAS